MKTYNDPFTLSLAMMRASGYAVAMQMHCATVFARSMMEFASAHAAAAAQPAAAPEREPEPAPKTARKSAPRRKPAAKPAAKPTAPAKPRLVASSDAPAPSRARRQPSAPPAMPATGTDET